MIESFAPFASPDSARGMVIGNDLDSVVSACFLKNKFGWDVTAIYDYKTLWYPADEGEFLGRFFQGSYVAID
ncbi:MAG: hypothetical protein PHQ36_04275, partial [Anaerolineales bacterium]|nr:hypothetical protein [Anaerolineales bacterium]